jgi:vancomycin resistance protein VanJ
MIEESARAPQNTAGQKPLKIAAAVAASFFAAWLLGQALRDRTWLTGLCFYIPTPALLVTLLIVGFWAVRRHMRRAGIALLLLAAVNVAFVAMVENNFKSPQRSGSLRVPLRVVHWNVFAGRLGWPEACQRLLAMSADAYFISEAPDEFSPADFPGYEALRRETMAVAVRGRLSDLRTLRDSSLGQVHALIWHSAQGEVRCLIADFPSSLLVHRHPQLVDVVRLIELNRSDLVLGDFNAPRRSAALSALPLGYAHAYDSAGSGWSYTWPVPVPCYALDQCLHGPRIHPHRYDLITTRLSDHRLQQFEFQLELPSPKAE